MREGLGIIQPLFSTPTKGDKMKKLSLLMTSLLLLTGCVEGIIYWPEEERPDQ